jgi:hypothetical protein
MYVKKTHQVNLLVWKTMNSTSGKNVMEKFVSKIYIYIYIYIQ